MHGDGHGGIYNCHGLDVSIAPLPALRAGKDVTCVFSNPPFAGREEDTKYLSRFETTKSDAGKCIMTPKSVPFVEHIINILRLGGVAALVLPAGIFSSQSRQFKAIRRRIRQNTEVLAIIGLPHWVFFHTGCDVQSALLFLRRTASPRADYSIFIDWADNVGYDAAGRKTEANDLPDILDRYQSGPPAVNLFPSRALWERDRIDPLYYQPGMHQRVSQPTHGRSAKLTDLVIPTTETIRRRRGNRRIVNYVEVGDADKDTGRICAFTKHEVQHLPSRAKWIARENLLLIPNHRNSIKAGRSVTLVPPEHDGDVVTSRFIVVRSKVPARYLYHVLNLPIVKQRMLTLVSGSSSTEIKFDQLSEIMVPLPENDDFDLWLERIDSLTAEIEHHREALHDRSQELQRVFQELYGLES